MGDHAIDWQLAGPASRTPRIVLLHEGLGSVSMWRGFPEALAGSVGEPVLAWSRRGYGQSDPAESDDWPDDFMHRQAREALPQLLDAFDIRQAVLVGHSDGASIALLHAAMHPARTAAVVAMAPHLFVEPVTVAEIADAVRAFETTDLPGRLARHHRDPVRAFRGWSGAWLRPSFLAWNIEAEVARIACPVLAIQGEDDQYGTMRQIERIAELHADTRLVRLADCRHSPHLDRPDEVIAAIRGFLRDSVPQG